MSDSTLQSPKGAAFTSCDCGAESVASESASGFSNNAKQPLFRGTHDHRSFRASSPARANAHALLLCPAVAVQLVARQARAAAAAVAAHNGRASPYARLQRGFAAAAVVILENSSAAAYHHLHLAAFLAAFGAVKELDLLLDLVSGLI